jgi:hypothetical protein
MSNLLESLVQGSQKRIILCIIGVGYYILSRFVCDYVLREERKRDIGLRGWVEYLVILKSLTRNPPHLARVVKNPTWIHNFYAKNRTLRGEVGGSSFAHP